MLIIEYKYVCDICRLPAGAEVYQQRLGTALPLPTNVHVSYGMHMCKSCASIAHVALTKAFTGITQC